MPIRKVKKGYKIENVAGVSPTKKAATQKLKAIKASQSCCCDRDKPSRQKCKNWRKQYKRR